MYVAGSIEAAMVTYLTAEYATRAETATVHRSVPDKRPAKFVTVIRMGGPQLDRVRDSAQLEFSCYAETVEQAEALAYLTRALVRDTQGQTISGNTVYRVEEFAGPANLPNPVSHTPRYRFIEQVEYRMASE